MNPPAFKFRLSWLRISDLPAALGFLAPNLIGFLVFTFFPIGFSLWMAFTDWSLRPADQTHFVGLRNFNDLLGFHATGDASGVALTIFLVSALAIVGGLIALVIGSAGRWAGLRASGLIYVLCAGGIIASVQGRSEGGILGAGLLGIIGLATLLNSNATWDRSKGWLPGLLVGLGVIGIAATNHSIGGDNAAYAANDPFFWRYLYNTGFLMLWIPFAIAGSLLLALLLTERLPEVARSGRHAGTAICIGLAVLSFIFGLGLDRPNLGLIGACLWFSAALGLGFNVVAFRTIFYLPTFTSGIAVFALWRALYSPQTGPINEGLRQVFDLFGWDLQPPFWLGDPSLAKPALIMMTVWILMGGTNLLLYLAALSNIPKELGEAASIDGAGRWQRFRHITWPQLAPTTFFISVMAIIAGVQGGFEQARVMTEGGPAGATTTLSYYVYNKMYDELDLGYSAAISWLLAAIILGATLLNWRYGKGAEVE